MNVKLKKMRRMAILLGLVMMLAVVCASCVNLDDVQEVNPRDHLEDNSDASVGDDTSEIVVPEGATELPVISRIVDISPEMIAISGTCPKDAVISVTGGKELEETTANGEYFIIKVDLASKNDLLKVTAKVDGKDASPEVEVRPVYNATAQDRLDGNSVSVGVDSRLYFDKMADDALATNLYTASQLAAIESGVNADVNTYYYTRSEGQDVEMIYVLVPNVTTMYPEILPMQSAEYTIYDQVLGALGNTGATVIDMRSVFADKLANDASLVEEKGGIYRVTDSALTDFGAYLTYEAIMNEVATDTYVVDGEEVVVDKFTNAAPRPMDDFDWVPASAKGGNLVNYRELDGDIITEQLVVAQPKFSLNLGENDPAKGKTNIKDIRKYVDSYNGDYNFYTDVSSSDGVNGVAEKWLIETGRKELPTAIIYRDYSACSYSDLLAERFETTLLVDTAYGYNINFTEIKTYKSEGDNVVDFIIVIVSEENFDTAFKTKLNG